MPSYPDNVKAFVQTPKETCNGCGRLTFKSQLRQCSRCHLVKYCSIDCQKAAWSRHKRSCASIAESREQFLHSGNPVAADEYTTITKWTLCWRDTITMYGLLGMDLANHPIDRLNTHIVFLDAEFRTPRPSERARSLRLLSARIISRAELAAQSSMLPSNPLLQPLAEDSLDVLQVVLRCGDLYRAWKCGVNDVEALRSADKAQSRQRAETWELILQTKIERGDPM